MSFGSITPEILHGVARRYCNTSTPTQQLAYEIHPDDLEKLTRADWFGYVRVKPIEAAR